MGDIRQTNFRVDQEKADAFRAYCEANGINQATGFERMLDALELQQAKEAIPSRETEISEFERCLRHLQAAYLNSLELNEQAEARIREEFARQLDTKDRTISDYQDQIAVLKEEKKALSGAVDQVKQLQADLDAAREQAQRDRMVVADRDLTIKQLTASNEILQIKGEAYDELKAERDSMAGQLRDANQEIKDLKKDHKVDMERAAREAEKAQDAAVAAVKSEWEARVSDLKEQLQEAKIAKATALQEAEKSAHEADMKSAEEIRRLEQENGSLKAQLVELQTKLPKTEG